MSGDGDLVVSGSFDKTSRVWLVPMDARDAGDAMLLHVLQAASTTLDDSHSIIYSAVLTDDARILYTGTKGCGVRIWDVEVGKLVGVLLPDGHDEKKAIATVASLALVEDGEGEEGDWKEGGGVPVHAAGGTETSSEGQIGLACERIRRRLICGNDDGTITEWDANSRPLLGMYGYARAGVGLVRSLAARKVGEGQLSVGGTSGLKRSDGAGATTIAESVVVSRTEVVSGYLDGRVRV